MHWRTGARSAIAAVPTLVLLLSGPSPAPAQSTGIINRGTVRLVVGSSESGGAAIGEDIANILDVTGTRRVVSVLDEGATQSIVDLRSLRGIDIGLVQLDVLEAARTDGAYRGIDHWLD